MGCSLIGDELVLDAGLGQGPLERLVHLRGDVLVGFYANPGERNGAPGPTQRAAELEAPILALQAGADQNITAEMNEAFERALTGAGVEHELVTYEGAPHSFFDRRYEEFAEASEDAWQRVLEFLETHSA